MRMVRPRMYFSLKINKVIHSKFSVCRSRQLQLTELFGARDASCPKGKKMGMQKIRI